MSASRESAQPALVLVMRADHDPAVPSHRITCDDCGAECWLSRNSGAATLAAARFIGGGAIRIVCNVCLELMLP